MLGPDAGPVALPPWPRRHPTTRHSPSAGWPPRPSPGSATLPRSRSPICVQARRSERAWVGVTGRPRRLEALGPVWPGRQVDALVEEQRHDADAAVRQRAGDAADRLTVEQDHPISNSVTGATCRGGLSRRCVSGAKARRGTLDGWAGGDVARSPPGTARSLT